MNMISILTIVPRPCRCVTVLTNLSVRSSMSSPALSSLRRSEFGHHAYVHVHPGTEAAGGMEGA
jgi:hypothetical protein